MKQTSHSSIKTLLTVIILVVIVGVLLVITSPTVVSQNAPTNPADTINSLLAPKNQPAESIEANDQPKPTITISPVDPRTDHIMGNPDAPIKLVEYSDMDCPFCTRFHNTMKQIIAEYGDSGKVAWIYRHLPLSGHIHADEEAIASECVARLGNNDKFWLFVDTALSDISSSSTELFDPKPLTDLAVSIGIDQTAFATCLQNRTYESDVLRDLSEAESSGARGTPFTVVLLPNGEYETIDGAQSYAFVKSIIDANLK